MHLNALPIRRIGVECVSLRSEHVYYRALAALGIDTISTDGLALEEGPAGPSLWLPRFDVSRREGQEVRWGLESIYSLVGGQPAAYLKHQQVLATLRGVLAPADWPAALLEYLKRDLLNLVFGNSDNHGRNLAVLKTDRSVRLAPIYDFAPMKLDSVVFPGMEEPSEGTERSAQREALLAAIAKTRRRPRGRRSP